MSEYGNMLSELTGSKRIERIKAAAAGESFGVSKSDVDWLLERNAELLKALKETLRAYQQLMPGLAHIAIQDYANINEAPIQAKDAIAAMEKP